MFFVFKFKKIIAITLLAVFILSCTVLIYFSTKEDSLYASTESGTQYIKWVDFNVPSSLMKEAIKLDIETYQNPDGVHLDWIEMIAILGTKYGGSFSKYKSSDLRKIADDLHKGVSALDIVNNSKTYSYYLEAYTAVLGGFVGEYEIETETEGGVSSKKKYGLKAFSPIASGYSYSDFDDFGNSRNYGYKRKHLGHDMMALTGTPVIAIESGVVEVLGWNQYGGWRIGIRSFDGTRYYYYAHLRQNRPFAEDLQAGQIVMAGDVIGYVGHTGYSSKENTNGIKESHLHFGLQLIFDESQKDGTNQIWIDLYEITKLLSTNRTVTVRNDETKEHTRKYALKENIPEDPFMPKEEPPADEGSSLNCPEDK